MAVSIPSAGDADPGRAKDADAGRLRPPLRAGWVMAAYALSIVVINLLLVATSRSDYVGPDNDDAMRLVEVRDFLAGQGWFDLMQYRLGPEPGVLMHWSRLIDAPLAGLIFLFHLVLPMPAAEAWALTIWPLLWILPMVTVLGLAAERLGGRPALHLALLFGGAYMVTSLRFQPGSADHHNVQITLMAFLAASLAVGRSWRTFAGAGAACALALAIGAETTPLVAGVCAMVALRWAWTGPAMRARALGFCPGLLLALTVVYLATVPSQRYRVVTCDNLSFGYFTLAVLGAAALATVVAVVSHARPMLRFKATAGIGVLLAATAVLVAPQCLGNPLANLDPILVRLWLDQIQEAWSVRVIARLEPGLLGQYYAVGLIALGVCLAQLWRRDRVEAHLTWAVMLAIGMVITLVQVRGQMFTNMLSILPLALLAADLRRAMLAAPGRLRPGLAYGAVLILSLPIVWGVSGTVLFEGVDGIVAPPAKAGMAQARSCNSETALRQLAAEPATLVAASNNLGTPILRFTHHRVLSAPYHRNQAGMLAELSIGLASPADAEALLSAAGVGLVAFCPTDPKVAQMRAVNPDGLVAALARGEVPRYLSPLPADPASGMTVYRVRSPP